MSKSSEGQGHDVSNNVCEYEENRLTNERVIRGKQNFNANCLRRWTPARMDSPISKPKLSLKNQSNKVTRL